MRGLVYLVLLGSLLPIPAFVQDNWPLIQSTQKTKKISLPDVDHPPHMEKAGVNSTFDMLIRSVDDGVVYKIECGNPYRSDAKTFEYSGDFQCRMILAGNEVSSVDLLSEDSHRTHDWQSRARFFASEVLGRCGEIPNYGRERVFRLRGMKVTLSLSDIKANESGRIPTLENFMFRAMVVPDPAAKSEVAEAPCPSVDSESPDCPFDNSVPVRFCK